MDLLREQFTLSYNKQSDRYLHPVLHQLGNFFVRVPEPIPSRVRWSECFRKSKAELHIEMNTDGTIASRKLLNVVPEMIIAHRKHGMMLQEIGSEPSKPVELVIMFDGFPVKNICITHYCVANATLKPDLSDQSEQLLRMLCAARISETNAQLRRATNHHGLAAGFNSITVRSGTLTITEVETEEGGDEESQVSRTETTLHAK
eukprot:6204087-Pleurochrysis_carterae.AAC.1